MYISLFALLAYRFLPLGWTFSVGSCPGNDGRQVERPTARQVHTIDVDRSKRENPRWWRLKLTKKRHGPVKLTILNASINDVFEDVVRVDLSHRPFANAGRVVVIIHNNIRTFAVARGPTKVGANGISLDSATRSRLDVKLNEEAEFIFEEAGLWDQIRWAWHASNAMPRIAARLGVISVGLGFAGFLLGIISLLVSFAPALESREQHHPTIITPRVGAADSRIQLFVFQMNSLPKPPGPSRTAVLHGANLP